MIYDYYDLACKDAYFIQQVVHVRYRFGVVRDCQIAITNLLKSVIVSESLSKEYLKETNIKSLLNALYRVDDLQLSKIDIRDYLNMSPLDNPIYISDEELTRVVLTLNSVITKVNAYRVRNSLPIVDMHIVT